MDLERFGREFRELRERRGLTQDDVVDASRVYKDARSLRKIEAGARPRRQAAIKLLVEGLKERDGAVINRFLELVGYEPLREVENARLGLTTPPVIRQAPEVIRPENPPAPASSVRFGMLVAWKVGIVICTAAAVAATLAIHDAFLGVTAFWYAVLYAVSVLLESAYAFKGAVTVVAALLSFSVIWATSLAALWVETSILTITGLWIAITIFMFAAAGQWLLVRPALSTSANVPTGFQSLTGRTAHLKNTGYFLIFVFSFWAVPVHCVAAGFIRADAHMSALCLPPWALGILLLAYFGASLPMGHTLLSRFRGEGPFDLYVTLLLIRAILGFLLSFVCLVWYSSAWTR